MNLKSFLQLFKKYHVVIWSYAALKECEKLPKIAINRGYDDLIKDLGNVERYIILYWNSAT